MEKLIRAGLLLAILMPGSARAQSSFNGTWKVDLSSVPIPKTTYVWLLEGGMYQCKSCDPPIDVKADGQDQAAPRPLYDTISVAIIDDQTVREIEKKNGRVVSDEKFTVSPDGKTVIDEFTGGRNTAIRVAKSPAGSHALSGSWRPWKMEVTSDNGLLFTYKFDGDFLSMTRPTGESYTAKLDGTDSPYTGGAPYTNGVSVKRIDENTIEETYKLDGKATNIARMTITPDGKSMTLAVKQLKDGTTSHYTLKKQ
jgi:hypothetical protein